ncbi:AraC family transcriptional regulator [Streptosporangium sp. NPDC000509]|uniref:AraC family transcriptional regulator n=1 Tax=Streptosporangium sp. NPDC000509 TaxID=3366186 RepID=UPI0036982950
MDPYDDLLRGVRGEGAVFGASVLSPPWALRFADGPSLTLLVPLRGEGWIVRGDDARQVRLGEAAIVRGPEPFVVADTDAPRPLVLADTGTPQPSVPASTGAPRPSAVPTETGTSRSSVVAETGTPHPAREVSPERAVAGDLSQTILLAGSYRVNGEVARRLVRVLPPVLVVPDDHDCSSMGAYLEAQLLSGRPGHQIVLDRLLDWLLVCTLRDWFDRPEAVSPGWYTALNDDVVGPVLCAIHEAPSRPWTLASLATAASVSRTTLARRFTELVGEPPMTYLTEWRMALAADMLAEPAATVATVARRVGYSDAFGFSSAFKRVLGVSPSVYRDGVAVRAGEAASAGLPGSP